MSDTVHHHLEDRAGIALYWVDARTFRASDRAWHDTSEMAEANGGCYL